jgi:pyruvate dehydrogenase E1 component alpha subunit
VEEVEKAKAEEDPIAILRDHLFGMGLLDAEQLARIDAEARRVADEAADFAENSPLPDPARLYENVWAEVNPHGRLFFDGRERGSWR